MLGGRPVFLPICLASSPDSALFLESYKVGRCAVQLHWPQRRMRYPIRLGQQVLHPTTQDR